MSIEKAKQHNFLKVMIIIASISTIFVYIFPALIVKDGSNLGQVLLGYLIEIILLMGIIFLWIKVLPKMIPATNTYRFRKLTVYQVMMVLGIAIFSLIGSYRFMYLIRGGEANVEMIPLTYDSEADFQDDMTASVHAVLIAPMLEEMGFRVIPISVVQTKKRKIVAIAVLSVIFGLMHGRNFGEALINAIVFSILFLMTRNPLIPILCHSFVNLLFTVAGAASYWGIIDVSTSSDRGPLILFFSTPVTIIALILGVALIIPTIFRCKNKRAASMQI